MLRHRVKPYYLHQLDPAPGTARFEVEPERGRAILAKLRRRVTGLADLCAGMAGGTGKVPIGPVWDEAARRLLLNSKFGAQQTTPAPTSHDEINGKPNFSTCGLGRLRGLVPNA